MITIVNLLRWIPPDTGFGWTHIRIERGTAQGGPFTELTSADITGYTASGLPIPAEPEVKDKTGSASHWYRIRFFDGTFFSDYSDPMQAFDFRGYCTLEDLRSFTNLQDLEYDDAALQIIIDTVTDTIDTLTGRTWTSVKTVTNRKLDGDGTRELILPHGDIGSITALSIDSSESGTYTSLNVTNDIYVYTDEGKIVLKPQAPVTRFPDNPQSVQVSYTHGNADPSPQVRELALLMATNLLSVDETRTAIIEKHLNALRRASWKTT